MKGAMKSVNKTMKKVMKNKMLMYGALAVVIGLLVVGLVMCMRKREGFIDGETAQKCADLGCYSGAVPDTQACYDMGCYDDSGNGSEMGPGNDSGMGLGNGTGNETGSGTGNETGSGTGNETGNETGSGPQ